MTPKILISCNLSSNGGCETHIVHLAPLLRRAGAEVTLVAQAYQLGPERERVLAEAGVRVVSSPFAWNTKYARLRQAWTAAKSRLQLRREFDTLLGVGQGAFHLYCLQFVKKGGWSIYNETGSGVLRRTAQLSVRHMRGVIAMSPRVARTLAANYGRRERIAALSHLTDPGALAELPPDAPAHDRELRVGFFGGLTSGKRPHLLVDGWRALGLGPARLDLHGGGELEEHLRATVREQALTEVTVHGVYAHRDLASLMAPKDFIVLPSDAEGLPQVLLEAMAHGVPFVATDVGGVGDLAAGNPDVLVVPPDPASVRRGAQEMARRIRAGEVSRHRLREFWRTRYSLPVMGERWRQALCEPERFFAESPLGGP